MICPIRDVDCCAHTKSLFTQQFQSEAWDLICMCNVHTLYNVHILKYSIDLSLSFDSSCFCGLFLKHPYKRVFSFLYSLLLPIEIYLSTHTPSLSLSLSTHFLSFSLYTLPLSISLHSLSLYKLPLSEHVHSLYLSTNTLTLYLSTYTLPFCLST